MTNQDCKTITTYNNLRRLKTAKLVSMWNNNCGRIVELFGLGCLMTFRLKMFEKSQSTWHELYYYAKFLSCEASILD